MTDTTNVATTTSSKRGRKPLSTEEKALRAEQRKNGEVTKTAGEYKRVSVFLLPAFLDVAENKAHDEKLELGSYAGKLLAQACNWQADYGRVDSYTSKDEKKAARGTAVEVVSTMQKLPSDLQALIIAGLIAQGLTEDQAKAAFSLKL